MSWHKMTQTKDSGGLGFKELYHQNYALLAKQLWKFITCPELLVSIILKSKFLAKSFLLDVMVGAITSWYWKSIMNARPLLLHGLRKRVRRKVTSCKHRNCGITKVNQLIHNFNWNKTLINQLFNKIEPNTSSVSLLV